jgi:regulatory protein
MLERVRRTRADLSKRLTGKGYLAPVIENVLDRLEGVGLIDDVDYARAYLASKWGRNAAGWRRLQMELRRKGVSDDDMLKGRSQFEELRGEVDELAGARRVIEQSARRYASLDKDVRRQRLWALLARRGFENDVIQAALKEMQSGGNA